MEYRSSEYLSYHLFTCEWKKGESIKKVTEIKDEAENERHQQQQLLQWMENQPSIKVQRKYATLLQSAIIVQDEEGKMTIM